MSEVTKLPIYKSLLPRIRKQDRAEFKRMLQLAYYKYSGNKRAFGNSKMLIFAFNWDSTPQRYGYWDELSCRLINGGHGDVA